MEIPDPHLLTLDLDLDLLAEAHDVFVHGVVDDFLEKDIDAVVQIGAVAQATDIHPRSEADVLEGAEGFDLAIVVGGSAHCRGRPVLPARLAGRAGAVPPVGCGLPVRFAAAGLAADEDVGR